MSATTLTFTVPGEPIPQGSAKAFVHKATGRAIVTGDNPRTKGWRFQVAQFAVMEAQRVGGFFASAHVPVKLTARCYFRRPASVSAKKRPAPVVKPDADKCLRALSDALTGVLWHDDAQVVGCVIEKHYAAVGEMARAELEVQILGEAR
ncbi:MAG TPA: RusA family crossover junction endodeoxyribonuclease [Gemmatimonadales bacterium]|nr:RusA family crossover junction endodeoxyribonuclease [Gemmatimonadales bacterium]